MWRGGRGGRDLGRKGDEGVILFNVQKEVMEVPRHFLNKSPYFLSIQETIKDAKVHSNAAHNPSGDQNHASEVGEYEYAAFVAELSVNGRYFVFAREKAEGAGDSEAALTQ